MTASIVAAVQLETRGVDRGVSQIKSKLGGLASSTSSVFKGVLGATAVTRGLEIAGAGLAKFSGLLGDSVEEARESEVVGKTTAAVIKATGGAAKVTAGQVGDLATSISNKTGVDDEAIQSGSNLLLTFKNVRNEAGKGGKVFDRATAAAVDLSKSGFGSVDSASKMLGKALNDPVKGMSALSRAGVTFSSDQQKTIKQMVKTGDVLGAQKLILKEVESQVGGVAAANATAGEKAAVMAGNLKEQFGTALLPVLDRASNYFTSTLGPAISKGIDLVMPAVDRVVGMIGPAVSKVAGIVGPIVAQVQASLAGIFAAGGGGGLGEFLAQLQPVGAALLGVFSSVQSLVAAVLPVVVQVFATIVAQVQSSLPQLTSAYQAIASTLSSVASIITTVWTAIGPTVLPILTSVFGTIISVVSGALNIVAGIFRTISAVLTGDWAGAWAGIRQIVSGAWTIIKAVVANGAAVVRGLLSAAVSSMRGLWSAAWSGIRSVVAAAWSGIKSVVSAGAAAIHSAVSSRLAAVRGSVSSAWSAVKSLTSAAWSAIKSAVSSGISNVISLVKSLPGKARSALGGIGSALRSAGVNLVRGFAAGISSSLGFIADRARQIARTAINAAKSALGIASPSKVFRELGGYVGQGFIVGLRGTEPQVVAAMKTLSSKMQAVFKERRSEQRADKIDQLQDRLKKLKKNSKKNAAAIRQTEKQLKTVRKTSPTNQAAADVAKLTARYASQVKALTANARARTALTAKITAERAKLAELQKQQADYRQNVTRAAAAYAGILTATSEGPQTVANITTQLQERYVAVRDFTAKMAQLRESGLNKGYLDELFAGGVEKSGDTVNALLGASAEELAEVNALQAKIAGQATALGNLAGDALFGAGVAAQQGLVNGLLADQKKLEAAAAKIAKTLTTAVKKALGIKSPSRVFRALGDQVTAGLVVGLDARVVERAGQSMATALTGGFGDPALRAAGAPSAVAGAGQVVQQITVEIRADATTNQAELGRNLTKALKAYQAAGGQLVGASR